MQESHAPLVHLEDLRLTYDGSAGQVEVLKGLNLQLGAGETLSLVGPSGSGKSSLLMLVAGLERPTGGRMIIDGQDLTGLDEDALALFRRARIGIVFQHFHLIPTMTALENVAVPLELAGLGDAFDRAREALGKVGLSARKDHYPSQLSGGEQQRVALARAAAVKPKLLLADEPTGNLDGETGGRVIDLLFSLQEEENSTLLLITHDPSLAARCDRQLRLREGLVLEDRDPIKERAVG